MEELEIVEVEDTVEEAVEEPRADIIRKRGSKWVLLSKKTGKTLGTHPTREAAVKQEQAIKASQERASKEDESTRFRRYDLFTTDELRAPERRADGFLKVEGRISRVGVQEYQNADGSLRRELRLPEDVFSQESLDSFKMVPVTNTHPSELLGPQTAKDHTVGSVGENIRSDGDWVIAPLMITDADAILAVQNGRSQLSCGYDCEIEMVPGIWEGQSYDCKQKDIRGNHVALVDAARAGSDARIRLDSKTAMMLSFLGKKDSMAQQVKVNGLTLSANEENAPAIQQAFDALSARLDETAGKLAKLTKATVRLKTEALKTVARNDAMKARMIACDECDGAGMVDLDGEEKMCGYCDGAGKVRMHDAMKEAMPMHGEAGGEGGAVEKGDDDLLDAASEAEVEAETEKEAQAAHKDAKGVKPREPKSRKDMLMRKVNRLARQRIQLELEARKHLGSEAKLDGLDARSVKSLVIAKLNRVDAQTLENKSIDYVDGAYDTALSKQVSPVEAVLAATIPAPVDGAGAVQREDQHDPMAARQRMLARLKDANKPVGAK